MIKSIKHKGLKLYWTKDDASKLPAASVDKITRMLDAIDNANTVPQDFEPFKSWRIHPLKGELEGYWSLDVTGNWRLVFRFVNGNAEDLNLVDTH
jgi:proteic killer suppression protein